MFMIILLLLFYFLFPLVIIYLCKKWSVLARIGTIVLAYAFGLVIGTSGILPDGSKEYKFFRQGRTSGIPDEEMVILVSSGKVTEQDLQVNRIAGMQDMVETITILLAFPLIMFSLNIKRWLKYARKGFLSVALALISGIVMVTAGFFIWKDSFPDTWKLAGMFEGIYTGGTPNFAALKLALGVDADRFVVLNTYDIIVGAFLVLFFISVAPRLFRLFLPKFTEKDGISLDSGIISEESENLEDFSGMFSKSNFVPLLKALGLTILIAGIGGGIGQLIPKEQQQFQMAVVVLTITTLGILASLIRPVNRINKTFQLGMYLILVFSLTVATSSNLRTVFSPGMLDLILFITWCYFGSLILHIILAKIFRIDADNFLITSAAFVFSPPFVPLVANALKNKDVIVTGITGGVIGYVLGNYFGTTLAYLLKGF
ncbi:MAG TPA: DUF819 family protein [Bacteroidales bacterium]|jgi:uncharacterized membrane protein|nr:DUF819 family protein [Bacteroidales bacterium]